MNLLIHRSSIGSRWRAAGRPISNAIQMSLQLSSQPEPTT